MEASTLVGLNERNVKDQGQLKTHEFLVFHISFKIIQNIDLNTHFEIIRESLPLLQEMLVIASPL